MKARDYLVKHGLAKPGRGKFSNAAREALARAVEKGESFDDFPNKATTVVKPTGAPKPKVKAAPVESAEVYDIPEYRYPETMYRAIEIRNGKRIERSMREACNGCGLSLVVCWCSTPRIVAHDGGGSVPVKIEGIA